MPELECPMQTKAFNIFWHKAELRLVGQQEAEAPVFAMSRPTLFGGREEFLLQYPARLEPPSERDISRHRFTVRHGKKRRSFQAPDADTFDTWLLALEEALEPKRESENSHTPSSVATTATTSTAGSNGTSSQGRLSNATRGSSRSQVSTLTSNPNSQRSHQSQPRAPALRLTLEWPCFTRDPNNLKLIRLHRPAATIAEAEVEDDVLDVPDTDTDIEYEPEEEMTEEEDASSADDILKDESLDAAGDDSSSVGDDVDLAEITANADDADGLASEAVALIVAGSIETPSDDAEEDARLDCKGDVATITATEDQNYVAESKEIELIVRSAIEALATVVVNKAVEASNVKSLPVPVPLSFTKKPAPKSSSRSASRATKYKWVPLDPNNSNLIWVRRSVETEVKSAPRSNRRRKGVKPARRWVPIDPNSTRPIWIRKAEKNSHTVRMESRYKATSHTRKWVPLDPESSRFIWVRHQVAPGKPDPTLI